MLDFVHLCVRTEYSFKAAYGKVPAVLQRVRQCNTLPVAAITDVGGTWGHPAWREACGDDVTPLYGVELPVVVAPDERAKQPAAKMLFLAKNQDGLSALYRLVAKAGRQFYYTGRLGYGDVREVVSVDGNLFVLAGAGTRTDLLPASSGVYLTLSPSTPEWNKLALKERLYQKVLVGDPRYPTVSDRALYALHSGQRFGQKLTVPQHVMTLPELRRLVPQADDEAVLNTVRIASEIAEHKVALPTVGTLKFEYADDRVFADAEAGAVRRGLATLENGALAWRDAAYRERFAREFSIIREKGFSDYFVLVADMIGWAKARMLVGPGRGSSAGSLLCYLLGITDVDPLAHGLLFERFIDVTRTDWPDIDVDFPDVTRESVFKYLAKQYGERRVARLGNVIRYKPDSALNQCCFELKVPVHEVTAFKQRVPPLPDGDTSYAALATAFAHDPLGQRLVQQYPGLGAACRLEGHASTSGTHAGGVVVADRPLDEVCGIGKDRVLMVDKREAEKIGMLKVDVLGLTTLSILDACLTAIGRDRDWLVNLPLDDAATYDVFKRERVAGIFQFEGKTQGALVKSMAVERFADIVALGALSRPGPLDAGATATYIKRRMGREATPAVHPIYDTITAETYGIIAYQEQMMACMRELGGFDWPLVSKLRKAINKKMGADYFNEYRQQFAAGAVERGMAADVAERVWDNIVTFGEYAFNKSHAVAYGLLSYWCAYLKAHHALAFACAVLNKKDDEACCRTLRDLVREGYEFSPVDADRSELGWTVHDGRLVGGLTTVVGIGDATAKEILNCRRLGVPVREAVAKKLRAPQTPFDNLFEAEQRFGEMYRDPKRFKIASGPLSFVADVDQPGTFIFLGRILEVEPRQKDGQPFVKVRVADDTDDVWVRVNRREYGRLGRVFVEGDVVVGKWCVFKGEIYDDYRIVNVEAVRWLDPKPTIPSPTSPPASVTS